MRITADTNVLLRAMFVHDLNQSERAQAEMTAAETVAVTTPALCEFVWVLSRGYKVPAVEIAEGIRRLMEGANIEADRPSVEAGLAILDAGGDFADGMIAYEGRWLGGDLFVSFDRRAVKLITEQGNAARLVP